MKRILFLLWLLVAWSTPGHGEAYRIETISEGLDHPWSIAFLPDGRMLVTERPGRLRILGADGRLSEPVANVPPVYHSGQGGLFDVVLHPGFRQNRLVFLSYAEGTPGDNGTAVARAELNSGELKNLQVIFRSGDRKDTPVHYGGRIAFLPDGTLLLCTGDGFDYREAAQDQTSMLGKLLRMNEDGSPASGNPLPLSPYVWSYGHRNPQGLAVDSQGRVFQHEHGPHGGDELNVIEAGVNYGWPAITHGRDYNGAFVSPYTEWVGMSQPLHFWTPSIAPSGLAIYEGDLFPQWRGDLFVGALVARDVRRLKLENDVVVSEESLFGELDSRIRDVRMGPDGALYLLTDANPGRIVRIIPDPG